MAIAAKDNSGMPSSSPLISSWREHVEVRRSTRAKHVRLKLHPSGRIELVVPRGVSAASLPSFLEQYEGWIVRNLERLGANAPRQPVVAPQRIQLPAIGEHWEIEYLSDDGGRYGCRPNREGLLRVSGGEYWQPALRRWVARKGKRHLLPWLEQVSDETGLDFSGATVRGQKTRWGSCSSRRHINLNYGLLFMPPRLVRYLFIHELCHTRHMNHSSRYWRLVAQHEPDYRELDTQLRRGMAYLPDWLHAEKFEKAGE